MGVAAPLDRRWTTHHDREGGPIYNQNDLSEAASGWRKKMLNAHWALMASLPPERWFAELLRMRRSILLRAAELHAMDRGAPLTFQQLRQKSSLAFDRHRLSLARCARFQGARIWRQADIEVQLELLTQTLEDRIAGLCTLNAVRHCYVEGLDPPLPGAALYVNTSHPEAEQIVQTQKRLLAALSAERQAGLIRRLARACLARARELEAKL